MNRAVILTSWEYALTLVIATAMGALLWDVIWTHRSDRRSSSHFETEHRRQRLMLLVAVVVVAGAFLLGGTLY